MINRLRFGIALIAFCTLVLELSLVRVFDVALTPNMGYAVVTATVFALGLGGIYLYIVPVSRQRSLKLMPWLYLAFALATLALLPVMNALPFDLNLAGTGLKLQLVSWMLMYGALITPFFIAGLVISMILTHFSEQVHSLYFFDLIGAGLGCVVLIPLIAPYGPAGIQVLVAGMALVGAMFYFKSRVVQAVFLVAGLALVVYPATLDEYLEYRGHANKRGVDEYKKQGLRDYLKWDPVSKVEVIKSHPTALNFALDGGQQGSWLQTFSGDFSEFDRTMAEDPDGFYFGMNSVVHYFKQGSHPDVLVIGAAVGSESKAAILFGAERVDSIELVGAMVDAAKTRYAEYSGNAFNHPKIDYRVGEGRTFLRGSDRKFDIIQMFSNHTSSSIADGSGAVGAAYLQTVEAYTEYFTSLSEDGMMQINHHIYPRMLTTAAEAWRRLGKTDFSRHVLVMERWIPDTLPAMFIKMKPWTAAEVERIQNYMNREAFVIRLPGDAFPSRRIYKDHEFAHLMTVREEPLQYFSAFVGTYGQQSLEYDLKVEIFDGDTRLVEKTIPGEMVRDNSRFTVDIGPIDGVRNRQLRTVMSSENEDFKKAISIWMAGPKHPVMDFRGKESAFLVAFNPLDRQANLIPAEFLDSPFDYEKAAAASYNFSPVTDNNPYFGMIRQSPRRVSMFDAPYMDYGTEYFLNIQKLKFLTSDWLNLFIVASIAVAFSLVFIFVPLFFSKHGRARWPGMGYFLIYFCCLGGGFILIELVLIQLFKKLIGYPTHTYATVIFSLLITAGLGSLLSKPLRVAEDGRWKWMFSIIIGTGLLFIFTYQYWFQIFLSQPLPLRVAAAVAMLAPMGFVMGMPLPIAISKLGKLEPGGIPWAWAMNGFFTVFGGFLSVLIAFTMGFQVVMLVGFAIYLLAFYMYSKMELAQPG